MRGLYVATEPRMSPCTHHESELKAVGLRGVYVATEPRMSPCTHHEFELKAVAIAKRLCSY